MPFFLAWLAWARLPLRAALNARIGTATMISAVVCGQSMFSLIIDRFGPFGLTSQPLSLRSVLSACLLLCGAYLIR